MNRQRLACGRWGHAKGAAPRTEHLTVAQSRSSKTRITKPVAQPIQERAKAPATNHIPPPRPGRSRAGERAPAKSPVKPAPIFARAGLAKAKPGASGQSAPGAAAASPSLAASVVLSASDGANGSKQARVVALLGRSEGATIAELMHATGWLAHSVRGAISGVLKRKLGMAVESRVEPGRGRVYRTGAEPGPVTAAAKSPSRRARAPRATTAAAAGELGCARGTGAATPKA